MRIQQLFIRSNHELLSVVNQITDDHWNIEMPAGLSGKPTTLGESIKYHIYDDAWVADVLAGKTKQEVGDKYEFLLTTTDIKSEYAKYNDLAIKAVEPFTELDRTVHLSYGDFPAREYLQHITLFRSLRSYDIAILIGVSGKLAADFVQALLEEYSPLADGYRQYGILPAALPAPDDADAQTKFLALVGRE